jgi:hypothetical protein
MYIILDSQSCCLAGSVRIKYIFSLNYLFFPAFTEVLYIYCQEYQPLL